MEFESIWGGQGAKKKKKNILRVCVCTSTSVYIHAYACLHLGCGVMMKIWWQGNPVIQEEKIKIDLDLKWMQNWKLQVFIFTWEECIGKVTISKICCLACQIDHCYGSLLILSANLLTLPRNTKKSKLSPPAPNRQNLKFYQVGHSFIPLLANFWSPRFL